MKEPVFACDMLAIDPSKRDAHLETIKSMFGAVRRIIEEPDGFTFEFHRSVAFKQVAGFVEAEMLCCPFFGFRIDSGPESGSLRLALYGSGGVKPFIQAELGAAVNKEAPWPSFPGET